MSKSKNRATGKKRPMIVYTVRLRPEVVAILRSKVPYVKIREGIEHIAASERLDRKESLWPPSKRRKKTIATNPTEPIVFN